MESSEWGEYLIALGASGFLWWKGYIKFDTLWVCIIMAALFHDLKSRA